MNSAAPFMDMPGMIWPMTLRPLGFICASLTTWPTAPPWYFSLDCAGVRYWYVKDSVCASAQVFQFVTVCSLEVNTEPKRGQVFYSS